MTLEKLLEKLPAYAKDLRVNMQNVLKQAELTPQQAWGSAVASALASRNPELLEAVLTEARERVSDQVIDGARTASSIMGMNNVYYRFLHLSSNERYRSIPARLRMQGIRSHGVDQLDFELWCTAVSAINGCGACVDSHEQTLRNQGVTEETILAAVRIASVVHAVACVLDGLAAGQGATAETPAPALG